MPIPSFTETLGSALGPGVTIIQDGNLFGNEEESDIALLNIHSMNNEIAATAKSDDIVFVETGVEEDLPLQAFLATQGKDVKK